jgi:hypothetical protein
LLEILHFCALGFYPSLLDMYIHLFLTKIIDSTYITRPIFLVLP